MIAMVRDDIIDLETFVQARFYFDYYLKVIHESGGYVFLMQFGQHWGDFGGAYLAERMIKAGLLGTKFYSNFKFAYLTETALKYLIHGDSKRDFSNISKNRISIKKLTHTPSDKQLFSSAMKFAFIALKKDPNDSLGKSGYKKVLLSTIEKRLPRNILRDEQISIDKLIKKCLNYYDISKIMVLPLKNGTTVEFAIFDTGEVKSTNYYFKLYKDLVELIPQISIGIPEFTIVSYSERRAEALLKQFDNAREKRIKAMATINKSKGRGKDQDFVVNLKKIIESVPQEFTARLIKTVFYLEKIKGGKVMRKNTKSIKPKDKKAAEQMKRDFAEKG